MISAATSPVITIPTNPKTANVTGATMNSALGRAISISVRCPS